MNPSMIYLAVIRPAELPTVLFPAQPLTSAAAPADPPTQDQREEAWSRQLSNPA